MRLAIIHRKSRSHRGAVIPEYAMMFTLVVIGLLVFMGTLLFATQIYFDNRSDRFNDLNSNRGPLVPNQ